MPDQRLCHIVSGSVEEESGAYDLFDLVGTPDEIGRAITDSLKEADLYSGQCPSAIDAGHDVYLTVKIKICKLPATHEPQMTDEETR